MLGACPLTLTPCCLRSLDKTFALPRAQPVQIRIASNTASDGGFEDLHHSFISTKKKAHSQSNKITLAVGSPKPPSSFDLTIDLYSAVLSAERFTVADRGELFRTSCLWQAVVQSQPIRNVHLCQIRRSAWHLIRGSTRSKS